jgi:drug/metabolite transporter (DMT)-like permease
MDASAKWLGTAGDVPPVQLVALRYFISFLFTGFILNPFARPALLRTRRPVLQITRAACLVLSTACTYVAVRHMSLTEMTAIVFAAPLIVPLLSVAFLGEKVGPRRVLAIVVGFCGVLVITRPGGHELGWVALLPLLGALLNAFYSVSTRKLASVDAPETTMFYTGMVGSATMMPALFFVWETPEGLVQWTAIILMGAGGALAHWLLILAHKHAPASLLAPFNYAQIIGAALIGLLVFGDVPDSWTFAGAAIIILSGLYVFYREQVVRRENTRRV